MNDYIDDFNFLLFCAKNYDNAQCHDTEEFYEDLRRIKYIKKLVTRYIITGDLKERLILNHLIINLMISKKKILIIIIIIN